MNKVFAFVVLVVSLIFGASVSAEGISPKKLSVPSLISYFAVKEDLVVKTTVKNVFGRKTTLSPILSKGNYISVFSDSEGTFYQGPKDCLPNPNKGAMFKAADGGLWIPNSTSKQTPKLWFYLQPMPDSLGRDAGLLIRALDGMSTGNIKKDIAEIEDLSMIKKLMISPFASTSNSSQRKETP